jgi:hypothetical protein
MNTLVYIMRGIKGMEGILGINREDIRIIMLSLSSNQLRT